MEEKEEPTHDGLSLEELMKRAETTAQAIDELQPAIQKEAELQDEKFWLDLAASKIRVEAGNPTFKDLSDVRLMAGSRQYLHDAMQVWLSKVTSSGKVTLISLADGERGSSEYSLVPFHIDLTDDVTDELVNDVEVTALALNRNWQNQDASYNVNGKIYIHTWKENLDDELVLRASLSEHSFASSRAETMSVREALIEAYNAIQPEPVKKTFFGFFKG